MTVVTSGGLASSRRADLPYLTCLYSSPVSNDAWIQLALDEYETYWGPFDDRFAFTPGMDPARWPAIREPSPSMTIGLSPIFDHDGSRFASGARTVDAMCLYAFTCQRPRVTRSTSAMRLGCRRPKPVRNVPPQDPDGHQAGGRSRSRLRR